MTATGPRRNGTRAASWIVAAAVLWTAAPNAAAWAAPDNGSVAVARAKIFDNLARRIMKGFRGPQGTLQELGLLGSGRKRVAVLPFDTDKIPVSEALAVEFHEDFIAALTRAAQGSIIVIQRQNLPAMIRDLREFGTSGNTVNAIIRKARADVLIHGRIGRNGDVVKLSFSAFNSGDAKTAAIIASTGSHEVPVTVAELEGMKVRLELDQVINAATRYFTGKFSDISELRLGGIRYQASGVQPRLGRYLEDKLMEAFTKAHRGALTGSRLIVSRAEGGVRGIETAEKPIRPEIADAGAGVYVLTGSYWPFGQAVELRLQLTDRQGGSELWSGRFKKPSTGQPVYRVVGTQVTRNSKLNNYLLKVLKGSLDPSLLEGFKSITLLVTKYDLEQKSNPDFMGQQIAKAIFGRIANLAGNISKTITIYHAETSIIMEKADGQKISEASKISRYNYQDVTKSDHIKNLGGILKKAVQAAAARVTEKLLGAPVDKATRYQVLGKKAVSTSEENDGWDLPQ